MRGLRCVILATAAFLVLVSVVYSVILPLERAFPLNQTLELSQLRARDRVRHARILQGVVGGVVDFSVEGSSDPLLVGLYFTKVKLGSPPREFNVQIDTGSDILWVTCSSCSNCPQNSALGIHLNFFDTSSSSTAKMVSCSDPLCASEFQTTATECSPQSNLCSYSFKYGDESGTSGSYISDTLYFDAIMGESFIVNSSAPIIFGCSTYQTGDLSKSDKAIDGIFGFGPGDLSVLSQLSSRGITPRVFSHCLKGDSNGGGILVLGEILEPGIVHSPLVPSKPHYNLNLQSIAVNGQMLPIYPAAFAASNNRETIVDSGTTLTYLVEEAFDPFFSAKSQGGVSILGDLVLKDKIVVYDLGRQRLGWANYDCSSSVNVSITSGKDEYINAGQHSVSSSSRDMVLFKLLPLMSIMAILMQSLAFMEFRFL